MGAGYQTVIISGRDDLVALMTTEWLERHDVVFNSLAMRLHGDFRPDEIIKLEMAAATIGEDWKDRVLCVFDDRQKVVDMWRREGVTCFQVAPGDF